MRSLEERLMALLQIACGDFLRRIVRLTRNNASVFIEFSLLVEIVYL